jgi:hypothetical protein
VVDPTNPHHLLHLPHKQYTGRRVSAMLQYYHSCDKDREIEVIDEQACLPAESEAKPMITTPI